MIGDAQHVLLRHPLGARARRDEGDCGRRCHRSPAPRRARSAPAWARRARAQPGARRRRSLELGEPLDGDVAGRRRGRLAGHVVDDRPMRRRAQPDPRRTTCDSIGLDDPSRERGTAARIVLRSPTVRPDAVVAAASGAILNQRQSTRFSSRPIYLDLSFLQQPKIQSEPRREEVSPMRW